MEFYKFPNDFGPAQHFGAMQNQIGRRHSISQGAGHVHTHNIRSQEVDRLPQHSRFSLDASDTPTHNSQPINHRGVGICAYKRVRIVDTVFLKHPLGQVLQVHLVHDANSGWHHFETVKGLHAPLQELIARPIALELKLHIPLEGLRAAGEVDLD